jgi:hypothetical protein
LSTLHSRKRIAPRGRLLGCIMAPNLRRVHHSTGLHAITSCLIPADRESFPADPSDPMNGYLRQQQTVSRLGLLSYRFTALLPLYPFSGPMEAVSLPPAGLWPCRLRRLTGSPAAFSALASLRHTSRRFTFINKFRLFSVFDSHHVFKIYQEQENSHEG